ncbi:MAG: cation transporter [Chthoniobacterales bacterium]
MKITQIRLEELPSLGSRTHIEKVLQVIRGVREVQVQSEAGRVTVEHDDVDESELVEAVEAAGVAAQLIPENAEVVAPSVPSMERIHE